MLFNSLDFLIFLPIVFAGYWLLFHKDLKVQNCFVLIASYVFYGWWDWRFMGLIFFSSLVDFTVGQALYKAEGSGREKYWLWLSLAVNLGLLGFFKYFNFFTESFAYAMNGIGIQVDPFTLNIILPVGISFYTFQTLSYTLDIYFGKIKPTKDPIVFFAFVSFFPQLVAGPIERASNLLPQFEKKRNFDRQLAEDGLKQILWGMFKKVVIADNCAVFVNQYFQQPDAYSGSVLLLGLFYFGIQIYCDFSGYSDIAIGTGKLFGFRLSLNFNYPYFATSLTDFWRKWHISLTRWLTEYVYYPIAFTFKHLGKRAIVMGIFATFMLSGIWHGAGWHFVVFGAVHTAGLIVEYLTTDIRTKMTERYGWAFKALGYLTTLSVVGIGFIFFRAENIQHAMHYISQLCDTSLFQLPNEGRKLIPFALLFLGIEYIYKNSTYTIQQLKFPIAIRWSIYYALVLAIFYLQPDQAIDFIYFRF